MRLFLGGFGRCRSLTRPGFNCLRGLRRERETHQPRQDGGRERVGEGAEGARRWIQVSIWRCALRSPGLCTGAVFAFRWACVLEGSQDDPWQMAAAGRKAVALFDIRQGSRAPRILCKSVCDKPVTRAWQPQNDEIITAVAREERHSPAFSTIQSIYKISLAVHKPKPWTLPWTLRTSL